MRLATFNVNSIKVRLPRVLAFLERNAVDVLCLQELKVTDDVFPFIELSAAGYQAAVWGQRAYNGVAILSRVGLSEVRRGFADGGDETQARLVTAKVGELNVASLYVPNGQSVGSEAWVYKLAWLRRLRDFAARCQGPWLLLGDFNIAPDDLDVANPKQWEGSVLTHAEVRGALGEVLGAGFVDLLRKHHPAGGVFSWWDYRMLGFQRGDGLRIDLALGSAEVAARCSGAFVDRQERKGAQPSDHAPVVVEIG